MMNWKDLSVKLYKLWSLLDSNLVATHSLKQGNDGYQLANYLSRNYSISAYLVYKSLAITVGVCGDVETTFKREKAPR